MGVPRFYGTYCHAQKRAELYGFEDILFHHHFDAYKVGPK